MSSKKAKNSNTVIPNTATINLYRVSTVDVSKQPKSGKPTANFKDVLVNANSIPEACTMFEGTIIISVHLEATKDAVLLSTENFNNKLN